MSSGEALISGINIYAKGSILRINGGPIWTVVPCIYVFHG